MITTTFPWKVEDNYVLDSCGVSVCECESNEVAKLIARLVNADAQEAPKWRPISTAPEQGAFQVWHDLYGSRPVVRAGWRGPLRDTRPENPKDIEPTHWMPLPPGPDIDYGAESRQQIINETIPHYSL